MNIIDDSEKVVKKSSIPDFEMCRGFFGYYFDEPFIKLPLIIVKVFGQYSLTLAAFASLKEVRKTGTSFRSIAGIAKQACLPLRTVKHHLQRLEQDGIISNVQRQRRRTVTRQIDTEIRQYFESKLYLFIPFSRLLLEMNIPWSEKIVLGYFCYQAKLAFECYEPRKINRSKVARELGLTRKTVAAALASLVNRRLIHPVEKKSHGRHSIAQMYSINI